MYNVLIIDDEALIAEGVKAKLNRSGIAEISDIRVACGGMEGIREAIILKPHIVITDMRMPDLDGIQVIRRLSAEHPLAKFILLSGYGDYAYVREAFKYGALDYLLKPARATELAQLIRKAIAAITEESRQAALAERSRMAERTMLASRLNTVISGAIHHGDGGRSEINSADLALMESYFLYPKTAVALLPSNGSPYSSEDLALAESRLVRNLPGIGSPDEARLVAFHDGDGAVCAVLNFKASVSAQALHGMLGETIKGLREDGAVQVFASVSETGRLSDLPRLYKQARLALSYRILRESSEVLSYESVHPQVGIEGRMPARKDIEELRHAVDTLQLERIGLWIDRWLPDSLVGNASLEQLETVYELLLTEIRHRFNGRLPLVEREPVRSLASFHALSDLRRYFLVYVGSAKQVASENAEPEETVVTFAESYIKEHFYRDVQLAEMANRVSMNYSYFSKLFKERTGLTFTAYLMKVRMEEARKLLKDPTLRINEVSEKVGYGNLYHFSRAFKNYFGISPKEYRRSR